MKSERIVISAEDKKQLMSRDGFDKGNISKSMNFLQNSMKARQARVKAVNIFGCHCYLSKKHLITV